MINLHKLAEQQKNQRALKIKNRLLQQTHDIKLAENLSPITKKINEVKKSTQDLADVIKKSHPETPQLAMENTPTTHQPINNKESIIYDVEVENTLNKMTDNTGFFKTNHDPQRGWMINNHPIKSLRRIKVEINENKNNISPGFRKGLVDQSYDTGKSMTDNDKLIFKISYRRQVFIFKNLQRVA